MPLNRIENAQVQNKKVLLSIDTDRIVDSQNNLVMDLPLLQSLDTIELLLDRQATVIMIGQCSPSANAPGFDSIAQKYSELLKRHVELIDLPLSDESKEKIKLSTPGEIFLLDNLYKYPEESSTGPAVAEQLAQIADLYINEAINSLSLATSSMLHLPTLLSTYVGLNFHKSLDILLKLDNLDNRPLVLVLGGNQIHEQIRLVKRFLEKVEAIHFNGALAYTFLKSRAVPIGNSAHDASAEIEAFQLIEKADLAEAQTYLPIDHLASDQFSKKAATKVFAKNQIPDGWFGMDIGPKTLTQLEKGIKKAGTVVWYGPLGAVEFAYAQKSSLGFAKALSKIKGQKIAIGMDTSKILSATGLAPKMDVCIYNSKTALEIIHKKNNPVLQALSNAKP